MPYGMFIENAAGNTVIAEGETSLLYWGKVTSVGSPPTNPKEPVYVNLFNIPSTVNIKIFVNQKNARQRFVLTGTSGLWQVMHYSTTSLGRDAEIYVFVEASDVPMDNYGMVIYNSDGITPSFHTSRPAMRVADIHTMDDSTSWSNSLNYKLVNYKAAVIPFLFEVSATSGPPPYDVTYEVSAAGNISTLITPPAGSSYIGGDFWLLLNVGAPISYQQGNEFKIVSIDGGYYDNFPNLGNW